MTRLPCIVGFGGANAAGRSSFFHSYNRMVIDALSPEERQRTLECLAAMMNLVSDSDEGLIDQEGQHVDPADIEARFGEQILNSTLIRRIEENHFNPDATHWHQKMSINPNEGGVISFVTSKRSLPDPLPAGWRVTPLDDKTVRIETNEQTEIKVDAYRDFPVKSGGQLPTGFEPGAHYNSRFQTRNIELAIFATSDAIHSMGIPWDEILKHVSPDEVGVYGGSALPPFEANGWGGVMQNRLLGERVTTKALAMGITSMPGDFINAYVLGNVGKSFNHASACATFLYNLNLAINDIKAGRTRVAFTVSFDSTMHSEVMDGFATMGALATEEAVRKLDGTDEVDPRTVSRPFGENCGFTMGEAGHAFILMDDELALEMGAEIYGAVPDVFTAADGYKKSITGPGPGNYLTLSKAVALAEKLVGNEGLNRSFIMAHGSSTPQNRVTESHIFHTVAETFGIKQWPVAAVKAYLGHTISSASSDQMISTLGTFQRGILPGIPTIEKAADDVYDEHLLITKEHQNVGAGNMDVAFLNSKGFGGTNATGVVLAPHITESMLSKRHGEKALTDWKEAREETRKRAQAYDDEATRGNYTSIYRFGEGMIDENDMEFSKEEVKIPGFANPVKLATNNPYEDML